LAQIGEFSFILAGLGVSLGLLPIEGQNLILAGALLSIALNPLVFRALGPAAPDSSEFKAFKNCGAAGGSGSRVAGETRAGGGLA
jgi:CPA2 family monovalent cation:H+ antiporter-2